MVEGTSLKGDTVSCSFVACVSLCAVVASGGVRKLASENPDPDGGQEEEGMRKGEGEGEMEGEQTS